MAGYQKGKLPTKAGRVVENNEKINKTKIHLTIILRQRTNAKQ